MQTTGKLLEKMPVISGEGKNGIWKKQDILLEIGTEYKKKLCVTIWGDKVNLDSFAIGDSVIAHLELESRQYNDKWYSDIKAWKLEKSGENSSKTSIVDNSDEVNFAMTTNDDLPF